MPGATPGNGLGSEVNQRASEVRCIREGMHRCRVTEPPDCPALQHTRPDLLAELRLTDTGPEEVRCATRHGLNLAGAVRLEQSRTHLCPDLALARVRHERMTLGQGARAAVSVEVLRNHQHRACFCGCSDRTLLHRRKRLGPPGVGRRRGEVDDRRVLARSGQCCCVGRVGFSGLDRCGKPRRLARARHDPHAALRGGEGLRNA